MHILKTHIDSLFPTSHIDWTEAAYPLLEELNPFTLAICLVGIGCNVLPGGITGVTPLRIWNELERIRQKEKVQDDEHGKRFRLLVNFLIKHDKSKRFQEVDLLVFCQAFLFQPALEYRKKDVVSAYKYIFHALTSSSPYLQMFLPPNIDIEEEQCKVIRCKGIADINPAHDL